LSLTVHQRACMEWAIFHDMSQGLTVKATWYICLIYLIEQLRSLLAFQHFNPPHKRYHLCFGRNGVFNRIHATPRCGSWEICGWWLIIEPFSLHGFLYHLFEEFLCSIICHPHEVTVTHGFEKGLRTVIDTFVDYLTECHFSMAWWGYWAIRSLNLSRYLQKDYLSHCLNWLISLRILAVLCIGKNLFRKIAINSAHVVTEFVVRMYSHFLALSRVRKRWILA